MDSTTFSNNFENYLTNNFTEYQKILDFNDLFKDNVIIIPANVFKIGIFDHFEDGTLYYREQMMDENVIPYHGKSVYLLENLYPSNLKGDDRMDHVEQIKFVTGTVNPSVRIGGLFYSDYKFKKNDVSKTKIKELTKWFKDTYGIKVSFRWSDTSGKAQHISSNGFNILAENEKPKIFTHLFQKDAHHYSHRTLFAFMYEPTPGNDLKGTYTQSDADEVLIQHIIGYASLLKTSIVVDAKAGEQIKLKEPKEILIPTVDTMID